MTLVRHCIRFTLIAGICTALLTGTSFAAQVGVDTLPADAAQNGDIGTVRSLVEDGANANAFGTDGTPALHWFIRVDDVETARHLVDAGADPTLPNRYGVTPLYLAAARGSRTIFQRWFLKDQGV